MRLEGFIDTLDVTPDRNGGKSHIPLRPMSHDLKIGLLARLREFRGSGNRTEFNDPQGRQLLDHFVCDEC